MNVAAVHQYPVVRDYMTPSPHTIGRSASLSTARHTMQLHHIRHVPVLEAGRIVGVLSERDLFLVETLPGVNPADVPVEAAMVQDVFTVAPDAPIGELIEDMIDRKPGSAIVCEGDRVVGVFTTIEALRALHERLERP